MGSWLLASVMDQLTTKEVTSIWFLTYQKQSLISLVSIQITNIKHYFMINWNGGKTKGNQPRGNSIRCPKSHTILNQSVVMLLLQGISQDLIKPKPKPQFNLVLKGKKQGNKIFSPKFVNEQKTAHQRGHGESVK